VYVCLSVGLSVRQLAYLKKHMSKFHEIFRTLLVTVMARSFSFSDISAIRYALLVM